MPGAGVVVPPLPPPETRKFPNFVRAFMSFVKKQESTDKIRMWTGLSLVATALERRVWQARTYGHLFPNLFIAIVAPPGLVKKSTTTGSGMSLLREMGTIKFVPEQITDASFVDAMVRSYKEFEYNGRKCKQSPALFYGSELSVTLKDTYGSIVELFTQFFDCEPNNANMPWTRSTIMHGNANIHGPCLNILGCTTPDWLRFSIPAEQMNGGFASRIIFVYENEMPDCMISIPKPEAGDESYRQDLINDLKCIQGMVGEMRMTSDAEKLFHALYVTNKNLIATKFKNHRLSGFLGRKLSPLTEKLAMCWSASERSDGIIEETHVHTAFQAISMIEQSVLNDLVFAGKNPLSGPISKVIELLETQNFVTTTQLSREFFRDLDSDGVMKLMYQLQQMGYGKIVNSTAGFGLQAIEQLAPPADEDVLV